MIKKSKKTFVPPELKDEKYWSRRRKNNIAAKKSRDARRIKENQIAIRASYLEKENNKLREHLHKLIKEHQMLMQHCRCLGALPAKLDPDLMQVKMRISPPIARMSPSGSSSNGGTSAASTTSEQNC